MQRLFLLGALRWRSCLKPLRHAVRAVGFCSLYMYWLYKAEGFAELTNKDVSNQNASFLPHFNGETAILALFLLKVTCLKT